MRRKALLGTVVGLMLGMVVAFGPNASAVSTTWYTGHVGPGESLLFSVSGKGNAQVMSPVFINFTLVCPVSGDVFTSEFVFFGFEQPVVNGKFDLNLSDPLFQRFDWRGTVSPTSATGHLDSGLPLYDGMGGLQDCATGNAVWHAKAVGSPPARPAGAGGTIVVTVTKSPNGSVRFQVVR
jgi:hypothetical protein